MPVEEDLTWGRTTVETACPLDCPDSCSLAISLERGQITKIDHSPRHAGTNGFICSKVRRFDRRIYGEERLLHPGSRTGAKGEASFSRITWDKALETIAARMRAIRQEFGAEAVLPLSYGGSNGLLSQDTNDARLFRAFGDLAPCAQRLRGADDHGDRRPLRPHGRRGLRGLPPRTAHRHLGGPIPPPPGSTLSPT